MQFNSDQDKSAQWAKNSSRSQNNAVCKSGWFSIWALRETRQ